MEGQEKPSTLRQKPSRRTFVKSLITLGTCIGVGAGGATIWWITRPHPLHTFHKDVFALSWSSNNQQLAAIARNGALQVWNTANYIITHVGSTLENQPLGFVAWSPVGQFIAASSSMEVIQIWEASDWSLKTSCSTDGGFISALAWSPDGEKIALGTSNRTVYVFQVGGTLSGKLLYTNKQYLDEVSALAWSPDGKYIASGSFDATIHIWDALTQNMITIYTGHNGHPISTLTWSPDSQLIASAAGPMEDNAQPEYSVHIWQATTGKQIYSYDGHKNFVHALAWEPHGTRIASASDDATVHLWKPQANNQVYIYNGHTAGVFSVVWKPDASQLASAANDGTVQVWQPG